MTIEWNFILRIFVAGLLGGLIGFEREFRAKEAGVRTHFIVALGSALFMVISQYAFAGRFDAARVAAQVVSGIGFIGAGVIIFQKNVIRGITTAAGLWVAAAIGLSCGAEMYSVAIAATVMTILVLETMHFITRNHGEKEITVTLSPVSNEELLEVMKTLKSIGADVTAFTLADGEASLDLKIKQKDYATTVDTVLSFSKGLKVEIS
ncbi:MAG: MgtC/SapB family protein [Bacteroidales bacterium]|nr:MgtC/SapB family protein [Bacteroidales bacterium]